MEEKPKQKSRASMIIDGDIEPLPNERYLLNLRKRVPFNQMDEEKRKEICRKGQKAQREIYGKKKSARESLENILAIKVTDDIMQKADLDPSIIERVKRSGEELTFYDLIHMVAVGKAVDGSVNAMQYVRDTAGDKPTDKVDISGEIVTDKDRELLQSIAERLNGAESVMVVEQK